MIATGIVYQKDVYDSITNLYLKNSNLLIRKEKYPIENIKVTVENQEITDSVRPGDLTAIYGVLEQIPRAGNPGQFDERSYYYPRKIKWYMEGTEIQILRKKENRILYIQSQIREKMKEGIQKAFGIEKGGIIQAMVLGEKGNLGQDNKLLFQIMGISHVLAISGMHLSVLGWGLYKLLVRIRFPIKGAGILSAAAMIFYGELTGSGAAAVRAVIMFAVSMGALLLKRTYDFLSALSLAAILLLAESPLYLYDSSFLLSFGAVLGLAAVHPVLFPPERKKYSKNLWGKVKKEVEAGLFSSISVWSILLPISMYFFYELSVWGFLVNLLILPTVGVLLISGLAGGILGLLPGLLFARAGALPGILILEFYIKGGKLLQNLPFFLWITGKPKIWQCLLYYGILTGILLIKKQGKWITAGKIAALLAALGLLFLRLPEGSLKVTFLDVGQGDCICIQQGREVCYIIDGGSSSVSRVGQYRILPFLKEQGISTVDGIFVSHMDEDHINGILELLKMITEKKTGLKIERLFLSRCKETEEQREQLEDAGEKADCEIYYIKRGSEISSGNLKITCLSPEDQNMEKIRLGKTGLLVTKTAFGALPIQRISKADAVKLVRRAYDAGINYFDTAPPYCKGKSEDATARALLRHPRDKYYIATKLSNFAPSTWSRDASLQIYHNSLRLFATDHLDYLLLHGIGMGADGMREYEKRFLDNGVLDFLLEEREKGHVRNLGFSYHGDIAVFDRLLAEHDTYRWDFVQIQLNYLDWKYAGQIKAYNSSASYLYNELDKRGIPVVVMEPLLGGRLSNVPNNIAALLKQSDPEASIASWAFRYAGSFPRVLTVLSGMSRFEHLEENIRIYSPLKPLTDREMALLQEVADRMIKYDTIPCNACDYCMPCPYGIDIPGCILHYNKCLNEDFVLKSIRDKNYREARRAYLVGYDRSVPRLRQASHCTGCGQCMPHCPQRIDIPGELRRIDAYVEKLKQDRL